MTDAASSFVDAAAALAPLVQASAEDSERSQRLPVPVVEAMAQAGLFRLWIPRTIGGAEADPMTLIRVVEEISRADGAAAGSNAACATSMPPSSTWLWRQPTIRWQVRRISARGYAVDAVAVLG